MTHTQRTSQRRVSTRPEARLQIDLVVPLDGRDVTDVIEHVTREVMWKFDAEDVDVTEVQR